MHKGGEVKVKTLKKKLEKMPEDADVFFHEQLGEEFIGITHIQLIKSGEEKCEVTGQYKTKSGHTLIKKNSSGVILKDYSGSWKGK